MIEDFVPEWRLFRSMTGKMCWMFYRDDDLGCSLEIVGKSRVYAVDGCRKPFATEEELIAELIRRDTSRSDWVLLESPG